MPILTEAELLKLLEQNKINAHSESTIEVDGQLHQGVTMVACAAIYGYSTLLKKLLANPGAPVDKPSISTTELYHDRTPLLWACDKGHTECVKLLLENNANILHCVPGGQSALMLADNAEIGKLLLTTAKQKDCFEQLLEKKTKQNLRVFDYWAKRGEIDFLKKYLLDKSDWQEYIFPIVFSDSLANNWFNFPEHRDLFEELLREIQPKSAYPQVKLYNESYPYDVSYKLLWEQQAPERGVQSDVGLADKQLLAEVYSVLRDANTLQHYLQEINQDLIAAYQLKGFETPPQLDSSTYNFYVFNGLEYPIPNQKFGNGIAKESTLQELLAHWVSAPSMSDEKNVAYKWIGFVPTEIADNQVKEGALVSENKEDPAGLFHGKISHPLQNEILRRAIRDKVITPWCGQDEATTQQRLKEILLSHKIRGIRAWLVVRDIGIHPFTGLGASSPHILSSIIFTHGKKWDISALSDFMIDSFCKGFTKLQKIYEKAHAAYLTPNEKNDPEYAKAKLISILQGLKLDNYSVAKFFWEHAIEKEFKRGRIMGMENKELKELLNSSKNKYDLPGYVVKKQYASPAKPHNANKKRKKLTDSAGEDSEPKRRKPSS